MRKITKVVIKITIIVILIFLSVYLVGHYNAKIDTLKLEVTDLNKKLDFIIENEKANVESIELFQVKEQLNQVIDFIENTDKYQIISKYQIAQESYENTFNSYLTIISIVFTIFIVTSIAVPLLNKEELKKVKNEIEDAKKEQEIIIKKNILMQEINHIYNMDKSISLNTSLLKFHIKKINKLFSKFKLNDLEKTTYMAQKANDFRLLEKYNKAEKYYTQACKYAEKTKIKSLISEQYYMKALVFATKSEYTKSIVSISQAIKYFPKNPKYLKLRMEGYGKMIDSDSTAEEKYKFIKKMKKDVKETFNINGMKIGALYNYYFVLNRNYEALFKENMDWLCENLDELNRGVNDPRQTPNTLANDYASSLQGEKLRIYTERGYISTQ